MSDIKTEERLRKPRLLITKLTLNSGETTTLHKHPKTHEYYQILSGQGKLKLGEKEIAVKTGDFFNISSTTPHMIWHDGQELLPLEILSVKDSSEEDTVPA